MSTKIERKLELQLKEATIKLLKFRLQGISAKTTNPFIRFLDSVFYYIRRYGRDKSEVVFQIIRFIMFALILLSIAYALFMFSIEINSFFKPSSKVFSESIIDSFTYHLKDDLEQCNDLKLNKNQINRLIEINEKNIEVLIDLKTSNKELIALKVIEHIFIYLLPFLVLLGLYYYFESNFKYKLLQTGSLNQKEIDNAEKNLTTTKTLFISSIMSYSIIKIIEKIFFDVGSFEILKIASYGIFLILLMGYLLISHNKSQISRKEI